MVVDYQRLRREVDKRFACSHEHATLRVKVASNGARHFRVQCSRCGQARQATTAERTRHVNPQPFDEDLQRSWWERKSKAYQQLSEQEATSARQAWLDQYSAFLQTPEWARCRNLVLERDGHTCRALLPGCTQHAAEVHHLTYDHWWNPPLFDLVAVCRECHEQITGMDRDKK